MKYPRLYIDLEKIQHNAEIVKALCLSNNIKITGVIKGFSAIPKITQSLFSAGYTSIASSRISHLKLYSDLKEIEKWLIRIPMISEVKDVVKYSDVSLNSEKVVLDHLNNASIEASLIHKVVLMYDVGDLREGLINLDQLVSLALYVEENLKNLKLYGVATNLTCYGTVVPTVKNANMLVKAALEVEQTINRKLDIISGGSTTSLPLLYNNTFPEKINHFRVGSAIMTPLELITLWNTTIPNLKYDTFYVEAEVVEVNSKPTVPIGTLHLDGFGNKRIFTDRGIRKRAILAIGNADLGDCTKLYPVDREIEILGASSDHLLIDIENCKTNYTVGNKIKFQMHYQNVLFGLNQPTLKKIYLD